MFLIDAATETSTPRFELVVEKLSPPPNQPLISRPRLIQVLEGSLWSCAATIVSGRAGTGKTSLALEFANACARDYAWYKVDAPDGELKVFCQYLIACVQQHRPGFGGELARIIDSPSDNQIPLLAEAFVYELAEGVSSPLLIVIEDLHLVCDSNWLVPFFRRVLPLLPVEVHLLITSRTIPPAPLWRMRSKQTLAVIDEEVLAFTRAEARELFAHHNLSPEQAAIARDHTRGRAAALAAIAAGLSHKGVEHRELISESLGLPGIRNN